MIFLPLISKINDPKIFYSSYSTSSIALDTLIDWLRLLTNRFFIILYIPKHNISIIIKLIIKIDVSHTRHLGMLQKKLLNSERYAGAVKWNDTHLHMLKNSHMRTVKKKLNKNKLMSKIIFSFITRECACVYLCADGERVMLCHHKNWLWMSYLRRYDLIKMKKGGGWRKMIICMKWILWWMWILAWDVSSMCVAFPEIWKKSLLCSNFKWRFKTVFLQLKY